MNAATHGRLRAAVAAIVLLAGAWTLPAGAQICGATPQPEARESAFDVDGLFDRGAVDMTAIGRARVAAFAQTLDTADIEAIVVRVPLASDKRTSKAQHLLAQRRASALRDQLAQLGVAEQRIYAEAAGRRIGAGRVVIETIAAWSPPEVRVALQQTCTRSDTKV